MHLRTRRPDVMALKVLVVCFFCGAASASLPFVFVALCCVLFLPAHPSKACADDAVEHVRQISVSGQITSVNRFIH